MDVPAAIALCTKLDGVPLAIEPAAGRSGTFGVRELARRLDDRFTLLAQGRRTALPRHQTLRATLNWSYGILPEHEQAILRRLAIFCGEFTMDSAQAVAASDGIGTAKVLMALRVSWRSRLSPSPSEARHDVSTAGNHRAYARKLLEGGEIQRIQRLHAQDCCRTMGEAQARTSQPSPTR